MSKELIEKQNDMITRAESVLNVAKEEKRELTDAEAQELAEIRDEIKRIKATLELNDDFRALAEMEKKKDETPTEEGKEMNNEQRAIDEQKQKEELERNAFENYVRGYAVHERSGEMTKGDNGAVIPTTIANTIIKKVYDICPVLERSQQYNVKGTLTLPYYPADANNITAAYQTEFVAMSSSSGKFGSINLTGFLAGALTKISRSLVNNAQVNIVDFVVNEMAYAIKRFIEHELLIGTEDKVDGLSTLTNGITAASASAITADELIQTQDLVKDEYQDNAIWIMSPATRTALRLLKDNENRYLLQDDISQPFGKALLGKPVFVSDNMPDIEDGGDVIYYGDMRGLATKFNEEINIQVLREKYADEHAYGVIGWFEFDAKVIDEQKLAKLTMGTSPL